MLKISIGQLAAINLGYFFPHKAVCSSDAPHAVVFMSDVSDLAVLMERPFTYQLPVPAKKSHFILQDDVLLQVKVRPHVIYVGANLEKTIASSNFAVIRCNPSIVLGRYLAWYLTQPPAQQFFESQLQGQQVRTLSLKAIAELEVVVPSLEKQRQVIELVDAKMKYDSLIQKTQAHYDKLIRALTHQTLLGAQS